MIEREEDDEGEETEENPVATSFESSFGILDQKLKKKNKGNNQ